MQTLYSRLLPSEALPAQLRFTPVPYTTALSTSELLGEQPVRCQMPLIFAPDMFRLSFVATA